MPPEAGKTFWPAEKELLRELDRMYKEDLERQQRKLASEIRTDRVRSENRTEHQAIAFNAGLSSEAEFHAIMSTYKTLGTQILEVLTEGRAATINEAIKLLYQEAGNEAGKFADWLGQITSQKIYHPGQPLTAWERLNLAMDQHDQPPKKKKPGWRKTKKWMGERFARWQAQKGTQTADDCAYEEMIGEWQAGEQAAPKSK